MDRVEEARRTLLALYGGSHSPLEESDPDFAAIKQRLVYGELYAQVLHSTEVLLSQNPDVRFDHYRPSMYLIKHPDVWKMEDIAEALDRFEKVYSDINKAL